jgi:hypothetical protein
MDPDATLEWIKDCLAAGNVKAAKESGYDLADWILRGGFTPADPAWPGVLHDLGFVGDYGPTRPVPGRQGETEDEYMTRIEAQAAEWEAQNQAAWEAAQEADWQAWLQTQPQAARDADPVPAARPTTPQEDGLDAEIDRLALIYKQYTPGEVVPWFDVLSPEQGRRASELGSADHQIAADNLAAELWPGHSYTDRLATRADRLSMWWHTQVFRIAHPRQNAELSRNLEALQREQAAERATERHPKHEPYRWQGVDRDGNTRSGETLMRDKTVPAMVQGFRDAGYQELAITRDGTESCEIEAEL